jgi:hypothetical protein
MAVHLVPASRPTVVRWSVLVLLLALVAIAATAGARALGTADRAEGGRGGEEGPTVRAEPGAAEDLPVPGPAPPEERPGTAERLRIRLLGGNPIFALDWLASAADVEAGRIGPGSPVP